MKAKIAIECDSAAVKRIVMLLMDEPVTHFEVSYGDDEARNYFPNKAPKKVTLKRPLLRDRIIQEYEDSQTPDPRTTAASIVRNALATGQVRTLAVLVSLCMKAGYRKNAASVALDTLIKSGEAERVDKGIYRQKIPAFERPPALQLEAPPEPEPHPTGSHADLVFKILADGEVHHRSSFVSLFEQEGLSVQTCDKSLMQLTQRHQIERLGAGNYRMNGADQHA